MADGLNRAMLLGNLGQDPELRYTQGGRAVLNMRLATTESYLDRDGNRKERTDWHNVVVWGKRAEGLAKFLHKGSSIFVEGSIRTSSFEGRDGQKRWKTEVNARNILLTGGGGGGGGRRGPVEDEGPPSEPDLPRDQAPQAPQAPQGGGGGADFNGDDDDIPF